MNIPPFWARAVSGECEGLGCSFSSADEAQAKASAAAAENARRLASGTLTRSGDHYYTDRPVREAILEQFPGSDGTAAAVVTRNSYGCLVLNAAGALFVDVDLPEQKIAAGGLLKRLLGRAEPPAGNPHEDEALARAQAWQSQHAGWSWRVYRTKAGLRFLATHALFSPDAVAPVFDALGADPLYRKLCSAQRCFRARLTPKPWRCGHFACPIRWPWRDDAHEQHFDEWQQEYTVACQNWSACQWIATQGPAEIHPELQPLVEFHDAVSRATSALPLA